MGCLLPDSSSWRLAASGKDYAVWESTKPLPEQSVDNASPPSSDLAVDVEPLPLSTTTHPVRITPKMSEETVRRILEEAPELVDRA